jgi:uncharacterized protein YbbC (DUF1343 family)
MTLSVFFYPLFLCFFCFSLQAIPVKVGADLLFTVDYACLLKGHCVGLITNHTAINGQGCSTIDLLKKNSCTYGYQLKALFAPEHGLMGLQHAAEKVCHSIDKEGIPIYSLHGITRRPTPEMLKGITLLIYDIQDIGSRSYTYSSTLFYVMEEAAKACIPVVILDRPNPLGGLTVDGPMLEEKWRSFVGYINVPYCHGLTIGELASYFNQEYKVKCHLTVIPMQNWKRAMTFAETGLTWIPTSPHIPEAHTTFFYPTTGLIGELQWVNIGIGYTLPFKLVGAPWINAQDFAKHLNAQHYPGVYFHPFHYCPFFGRFAKQACEGVLIIVTDPKKFLPVTTQYLIIGMLKSLYPVHFKAALDCSSVCQQEMFNKVNGTAEILRILKEEPYVIWKLRSIHQKERLAYLRKREAILISTY